MDFVDSNRIFKVLMIEDNPDDVEITREALSEVKMRINLQVTENGTQALEYLRNNPLPDLILLDLNLPGLSGREILQEIKDDDHLKMIPVVILTTSASNADILNAYQLRANCYISKPVGMDEFVSVVKSIENFWFTIVKLPPFHENTNAQ